MVDYTKRKISTDYWKKRKTLEFNGPQAPGESTKTVYSLATEMLNGVEYMTGLHLKTTGRYTAMPVFPEEELIKMVPGIDATYFRMLMLDDFSKLSAVCEVVGGTRVQMNTTVNISDIARKTNILNFNTYGLAVPMTTSGQPLIDSKNNLSTSSRLTYRHQEVNKSYTFTTSTLAEAKAQEEGKKNSQISTTNAGNAVIANSKAITINKVDLEMFAGNTVDFTTDFEYSDSRGDTWTASNIGWLKPKSSTTGHELDAQATDVLHVNGFSLSVPEGTSIPGFINHTVKVTLTL